jgi:hypothetical protein
MKQIFESRGGRSVFVELWADLETRLRRNVTEQRLQHKPSKRDLELSTARLLDHEARYRMTSNGDFPFAEYLRIDNTLQAPDDVARRIADQFQLRAQGQTEDRG